MLKAVIVDDEIAAQRSLEILLELNCPNVSIIGKASNVSEGIERISETNPDLVFLDIEMPQGDGFKLLEHFHGKRFEVVFITAYNQYALKAFKHNAIDYLLKPVDVDELVRAVAKVTERIRNNVDPRERYAKLFESIERMIPRKLAIPTKEQTVYVDLGSVVMAKIESTAITLTLVDGQVSEYKSTCSDLTSQLSEKGFVEVDKGLLVNLHKVLRFDKNGKGAVLLEGEHSVAIRTISKDEFIEKLTERSLGEEW